MKVLIPFFVFFVSVPMGFAQETESENSEETKLVGFEWLKQFEGEWDTDFDGTMIGRSMADRWMVSEYSFQAGLFSMQTVGYDEEKKQFVGSWVDGTSNFIWSYTGKLDEAGKVLILEAEGPDMSDPKKMRQYRDTYEFKSKDEIAMVTLMLSDDGEWKTFNKGKMTRKKKDD